MRWTSQAHLDMGSFGHLTCVKLQVPKFATVEDIMTKGRIFTVHEDTSIDEGEHLPGVALLCPSLLLLSALCA